MAHETHGELARLPTQSGSSMARFAIKGAEVHLRAIQRLLKHDPMQIDSAAEYASPLNDPAVMEQLVWRTRAFFWELVGSFDMFLQWANDHFALGVAEGRVAWNTMPIASSRNHAEWTAMRKLLEDGYNSEWYFEVRMYRNFAHRSILAMTSMIPKVPGETQVYLPHARKGQANYDDIRIQLSGYIDQMLVLGQRLFENKKAAQQAVEADSPASGEPAS